MWSDVSHFYRILICADSTKSKKKFSEALNEQRDICRVSVTSFTARVEMPDETT